MMFLCGFLPPGGLQLQNMGLERHVHTGKALSKPSVEPPGRGGFWNLALLLWLLSRH